MLTKKGGSIVFTGMYLDSEFVIAARVVPRQDEILGSRQETYR